ncbi:MAG: type II secretion system protein J [Desulfococcaceae bacterium]
MKLDFSARRRVVGFTLLELMISMTVLGIIMTLVYGAMRLGTRTWETGQAQMDRWQRRQAIMALIERQLGSIYLPDGPLYVQTPVFLGKSDELAFFSSLPLIQDEQGPRTVFVRYRGERRRGGEWRLLFVEQTPDFPNALRSDPPPDGTWDVLANGLAEVDFAYLREVPKGNDEPWEWETEWETENGKAPPAIRVSMRWEPDEPAMKLVVPIHWKGLSPS